jgi:tRNA pseudouridine55 synthase
VAILLVNMTRFDGLLVLDKPAGMTSRAALDRAQHWFPRGTRMGHTGTLDPLATGILVLCVGSATRLAEYVQAMGKTYRTTIRLGAVSDTDDADGTVKPVAGAVLPDRPTLEARVAEFVGAIEQTPPAFSAVKVAGRRAHDLARGGAEVELKPRIVQVDRIDILQYSPPEVELEVRCGKGTYIRSLARDLGARLGCGGHVTALRRTRVGVFAEADAVTLEADEATARARLLPVERALVGLPRLSVTPGDAQALAQGREVPAIIAGVTGTEPFELVICGAAGKLIGIGTYYPDRQRVWPEKVLS